LRRTVAPSIVFVAAVASTPCARRIAGGAQAAADLEAVDARHQHVEHERVGRPQRQRVEGLRAVGRQLGLVALQAQRAVDGLTHRGLVVDDQDAHGADADRRS
jgi:hypothetical protein